MRSVIILCKDTDTVNKLFDNTKYQVNSISTERYKNFSFITVQDIDLYFVESSKCYALFKNIKTYDTHILGVLLDTEYDEILTNIIKRNKEKIEPLKQCIPLYHMPITRENWESAIDDVIVPAHYTCSHCGKEIGSYGGWGSHLTKYYEDKCPNCGSNILWEYAM